MERIRLVYGCYYNGCLPRFRRQKKDAGRAGDFRLRAVHRSHRCFEFAHVGHSISSDSKPHVAAAAAAAASPGLALSRHRRV
jgi:hypothetical protein